MKSKFSLVPSSKFKKDFKKYQNQPKKLADIKDCLDLLIHGGKENLPLQMKAHRLIGNYDAYWECHIQPDLLLIWEEQSEPVAEIYLIRLGSHPELF